MTKANPQLGASLTKVYTTLVLKGTQGDVREPQEWTLEDSTQLLDGDRLGKDGPLRILVTGGFKVESKILSFQGPSILAI